VASLLLAERVPRTDSGLKVGEMIEFAIEIFLAAVVAGPQMLDKITSALAEPATRPVRAGGRVAAKDR
jgi:hypothetical protein